MILLLPRQYFTALTLMAVVSACSSAELQGPKDPAAARQSLDSALFDVDGPAPEGDCIAEEILPARIETVTVQTELTPEVRANDGSLIAPATFDSDSQDTILRDRAPVRFATPCPAATPEAEAAFWSVLQRALKVRGYFAGPVTGVNDAATGRAIRGYQSARGLDSSTLSLAAARQLGLAPYPAE